jgi:hypothetical protein
MLRVAGRNKGNNHVRKFGIEEQGEGATKSRYPRGHPSPPHYRLYSIDARCVSVSLVPRSVFWPAAFGGVLLLNLLNRRFLLLRDNRKIQELETELLRVKARLKNSN